MNLVRSGWQSVRHTCRASQTLPGRQAFLVRKLAHSARPALQSSRSSMAHLKLACGSVFVLSTLALLPTTHLDSDAKLDIESVVDPATSIAFPKMLEIPSRIPLPKYTLVGLGVRTVSFLGIRAYSVGFYADLHPGLKIPITATAEEKIEHIIQNTSCVIRIVPVRSTSYTHLRDAFMRSMNARIQSARQTGELSAADELSIQTPMLTLKSLFPNSPFQKGQSLDILLSPPSSDGSTPRVLIFRDLGGLKSDWLATQFILAYFQDRPPSPALKKSVFAALESFGA